MDVVDLNDDLRRSRDRDLDLPKGLCSWLPQGNTTIADLVRRDDLPKQSKALNITKISSWFSKDTANVTLDCIQERGLPDVQTLSKLQAQVGDAWLSGHKSVIDPRYNGGRDRLPLYVIDYWKKMEKAVSTREMWRNAMDWVTRKQEELSQKNETVDLVKNLKIFEAFHVMTLESKVTLRTNKPISTIDFLSNFLGDNIWIASNNIDLMVDCLAERVSNDRGLRGRVWVLSTGFSEGIALYCNKDPEMKKNGTAVLKKAFPEVVSNNPKDRTIEKVYAPFNVGGTHWVAICIDYRRGRIVYGDSLGWSNYPKPKEHLRNIKKWLEDCGWKMEIGGNELEHAQQKDGSSCGIITANTIAVNIFQDSLWAQSEKTEHRLRRFADGAARLWPTPPPIPEQHPKMAVSSLLMGVSNDSGNTAHAKMAVSSLLNGQLEVGEVIETAKLAAQVKGGQRECEAEGGVEGVSNWGSEDEGESKGEPSDIEMESDDEEAMDIDSDGDEPMPAAKSKSLKRPRSPASEANPQPKKKPREKKSSEYDRERLKAWKEGRWKPTPKELKKWHGAMLEVNSLVQFDGDHPYKYWCPKCVQWRKTKGPLDVTRGRTHIMTECTGKKSATKISQFFTKVAKKVTAPLKRKEPERVPCPGLTEREDPRIEQYLERTGASGGGGKDRRKLSERIFGKMFSALRKKEKIRVTDEQKLTHKWDNDFRRRRVYARECTGFILADEERPAPCLECKKVLTLPAFKNAISRETPDDDNRKFTPKEWISERLAGLYRKYPKLEELLEGDTDTSKDPILRYMLGRMSKKYDNDKIFEGLVSAFLQMRDREDKGKGMQNFKYTEEFLEFCEDIHATNPAAYRGLEQVLRVPTERSLQARRSKQPCFPYQLSERNLDLVRDHLKQISYDGPVGLGCDDTKLFAGLHLVWDPEKQSHFLVGGCDGPIQVVDEKEVREAMTDVSNRKGTKLRLWVLSIPYPKIPPVIVAAEPIADDLKADALADRSVKIIRGLISRDVKLVSYSCDGSDVERSSQRLLVAQADRVITNTIKSAEDGVADTVITFPVFDNQPIAICQDSKHGLKTFRNNLFSGARLLTLGNHVAIYERIRQLAKDDGSPLYDHDVHNVDRQDDGAATRLFSADVLDFISQRHPEYVGEIVYLFVFGELIDAYQNRFITHHERVKMVFRALHFLNHWEQFLAVSGYAKAQHTISAQAIDISRILINGYLSMLLIHRDNLEGKFPFLPWLHSTEPCEHVFGESRRIVKDFTFRDFLYMIPKLRTRIRRTMRHFRINAKASGVGYVHTYFDTAKLDAVNLTTFPTNSEMEGLFAASLGEVESLLLLLGIYPSRLRNSATQLVLPPIRAWLPDSDNPGISAGMSDTSSINDSLDCFTEDFEDERPGHREELHALLSEDTSYFSEFSKSKVAAWRSAAFAMEASEYMHMHQQPNSDEEEIFLEEDFDSVQTIDVQIKDIRTNDPTAPLDVANGAPTTLDFSSLVHLRRAHQTEQAAKCARTRTAPAKERGEDDCASDADSVRSHAKTTAEERAKIVKAFREMVRENKMRAPTQGLDREERWTGGKETGNAANAKVVAAAAATRAMTKRKNVYLQESVAYPDAIIDGRISSVRPLKAGDYIFILRSPKATRVLVGKVITMYSRSAGKNARNAMVETCDKLGALTKIAVQVYEYSHLRFFTPMTTATTALLTSEFQLLPPYQILCRLAVRPKLDVESKQLELNPQDSQQWAVMNMKDQIYKYQSAIVKFKKREPKA